MGNAKAKTPETFSRNKDSHASNPFPPMVYWKVERAFFRRSGENSLHILYSRCGHVRRKSLRASSLSVHFPICLCGRNIYFHGYKQNFLDIIPAKILPSTKSAFFVIIKDGARTRMSPLLRSIMPFCQHHSRILLPTPISCQHPESPPRETRSR